MPELPKAEKEIFIWKSPFTKVAGLERLDVFSLPALGPLRDFELHRLALLQAFETKNVEGSHHARLVKVKNVSADVSERQALSNLIRCSRSRDPIMKYDSLSALMSRVDVGASLVGL